jgi:hypothetical protein
VIRLAHQGIEYMHTGRFTMPMPDDVAAEIVSLRTGGYTEHEALKWAAEMEDELKAAIDLSTLPPKPAVAAVNRWLIGVYESEMPAVVD